MAHLHRPTLLLCQMDRHVLSNRSYYLPNEPILEIMYTARFCFFGHCHCSFCFFVCRFNCFCNSSILALCSSSVIKPASALTFSKSLRYFSSSFSAFSASISLVHRVLDEQLLGNLALFLSLSRYSCVRRNSLALVCGNDQITTWFDLLALSICVAFSILFCIALALFHFTFAMAAAHSLL